MVKYETNLICIICIFMNINKNAKNKGKSLQISIDWFHPNIVIVACFNIINVTIWQVQSSSGPIWILSRLNIHGNAWKLKKMRENHVKTISLREGLRYDLSCTPRAFEIHAKLFSGTSKCEMKFSSQEIRYGQRENAWFPWQPLIWFSRLGVRPTNSIISRVLLILEH